MNPIVFAVAQHKTLSVDTERIALITTLDEDQSWCAASFIYTAPNHTISFMHQWLYSDMIFSFCKWTIFCNHETDSPQPGVYIEIPGAET